MVQTQDILILEEKRNKVQKVFTKLEDSVHDIYRTDDTVGLLRYVLSMLSQDEIQLENKISDDIGYFLSKAIENLTFNFESNRLLLEELHRITFSKDEEDEDEIAI